MANKKNTTNFIITVFAIAICVALYFMTQGKRTVNDNTTEDTTTVINTTPVSLSAESNKNVSDLDHVEFAKAYLEHLKRYGYEEGKPTIVDFFATWCGPCKRMAPDLHRVGEELKDSIKIITVDVDKDTAFAEAAKIEAMPTLFFIDSKGTILRYVGALEYAILKEMAEDLSKYDWGI